MAIARIEIVAVGLTLEELNERIMGKGLEGKSIFNDVFADLDQWSVKFSDEDDNTVTGQANMVGYRQV